MGTVKQSLMAMGAALLAVSVAYADQPVSGSAGPSGAQNASGQLEHCDKPMGAMAVVEPQDNTIASLLRYQLQSPTGIIRLIIQQSNCFIVVERGQAMENMMGERSLAATGMTRPGSNVGLGQMVAADYIMTPSVVFSENNAGGAGAMLGGLLPHGDVIAGVASGVKFKEAQTTLLVVDSRSGVQVAAAQGSAKKADLRLGAFAFGGAGGGGGGGYTNTNEGKMIAASFADNYNGIVRAVRNNPSLKRDVGTLAEEAGKKTAAPVYGEGEMLTPKLASVKLLATPDESGKVVATLSRGVAMIATGKEENGYVQVESDSGRGWVKKILIGMSQ